ncbi:MAG: hypothetical protein ABIK89_13435 [Planctomycetota bacterium]
MTSSQWIGKVLAWSVVVIVLGAWTAAFWYEPTPSAPLPEMPDLQARTADVWQD